jgi:hypothetical protein
VYASVLLKLFSLFPLEIKSNAVVSTIQLAAAVPGRQGRLQNFSQKIAYKMAGAYKRYASVEINPVSESTVRYNRIVSTG